VLLIEVMPSELQIVEDASPKNGELMKISGVFAVADEVNGNGRVYTEAVLDREVAKLQPMMAENTLFGEADHPEDGKSRVSNTAAMLTGIKKQIVNGRKTYVGEAIVLPTTKGKDLQAIIRAGGKPGTSSRGFGTVMRANWKGTPADVVQEDFRLKTFDFVIGQSTKGAEVKQVSEQQVEVINVLEAGDGCGSCDKTLKGGSKSMEIKSVEDLRKAYPELVLKVEQEAVSKKEKEIKEGLQKEFDAKVLKEVEAKREEVKNDVIEELKKSDEFTGMVGCFTEIAKLIQPYVTEGTLTAEGKDEVEERIEKLEDELEVQKKENKQLKEQAENEKKAAELKTKVAAKITEVTAGKKHEKLLVERLAGCKTVEEVSTRLVEEEAFIAKLTEGKTVEDPTGKGKTLNEDLADKGADAEKAKARRLAGIETPPAA
jgi:hypothetical protein